MHSRQGWLYCITNASDGQLLLRFAGVAVFAFGARVAGPAARCLSAKNHQTPGGAILSITRCDCGGQLEDGTEQTERGPRWVHICRNCGTRWGYTDGVFAPRDEALARGDDENGALRPHEIALLDWFRLLSRKQQAALVFHARNLALCAD